MFGINGGEFIILAILAALVLGPDKLPGYAQQLAELVKNVRRMAQGAREQLREEVGDEVADIDWRKLDPRQYDPRRIIKEALLEDVEDVARAVKEDPQPAAIERNPRPVTAGGGAASGAGRLAPGEAAPFDVEAT